MLAQDNPRGAQVAQAMLRAFSGKLTPCPETKMEPAKKKFESGFDANSWVVSAQGLGFGDAGLVDQMLPWRRAAAHHQA